MKYWHYWSTADFISLALTGGYSDSMDISTSEPCIIIEAGPNS
jgi:hypothetical protein